MINYNAKCHVGVFSESECIYHMYIFRLEFFREREINNLVRRANFNTDLYVKEFGLTISNNMMEVRGRVLPPPKLQYGGRVSSLGGQVRS